MTGRLWLPGPPRIWTPPPAAPRRPFGPEWGDEPYGWPLRREPLTPLRLAASLVQHKMTAISNGASSASLTFTSATSVNNRILVGVAIFPNTITVSSVTDNGSTANSYHADVSTNNATIGDLIDIRSGNVAHNPSSGNLQVTVNFSSAVSGGNLFIQEVSGLSTALNAVDQTGTNVNTSNVTSTTCSLSANSAGAGEYVFGVVASEASALSFSGGTATTVDDSDTTNGAASCHKTANSAGGTTETLTVTFGNATGFLFASVAYLLPGAAVVPILPIVEHQQAVNRASFF